MYQIAFNRGYDAYVDGETLEDNPFGEMTTSYDAWVDGWKAAKHDRRFCL